jgi:hypothetical protein
MTDAVFVPEIEVMEIGRAIGATPCLYPRKCQIAFRKADPAIIANSFPRDAAALAALVAM